MRARSKFASIGIVTIGLATACAARETRLEPAPSARRAGPDTVVDRRAHVTIRAEVDAWTGHPGVLDHVTPVRVAIRNDGDRPLRIQYKRFRLVADRGDNFAALPPFQIEGSVARPISSPYSAADPYVTHPRFLVDPLYQGVYPGVTPYRGPIGDFDPFYYDTFFGYWRQPLPTPEMQRRALPEGVLQPGGHVSGFLYFQKPGDDIRRVRLTADLVDARTGTQFATARMPFVVEEG